MLKLAGPVAEEIGLAWQEQARVWRLKRALRLAKRVDDLLEAAGAQRRPIPTKLLLPSLAEASLEDDEDLTQQWAALLANAGDANGAVVSRGYVEVLKQLSPIEAHVLSWLVSDNAPGSMPRAEAVKEAYDLTDDEFEVMAEHLASLGLCEPGRYVFPTRSGNSSTLTRTYDTIGATLFGRRFVQACTYEVTQPTIIDSLTNIGLRPSAARER